MCAGVRDLEQLQRVFMTNWEVEKRSNKPKSNSQPNLLTRKQVTKLKNKNRFTRKYRIFDIKRLDSSL